MVFANRNDVHYRPAKSLCNNVRFPFRIGHRAAESFIPVFLFIPHRKYHTVDMVRTRVNRRVHYLARLIQIMEDNLHTVIRFIYGRFYTAFVIILVVRIQIIPHRFDMIRRRASSKNCASHRRHDIRIVTGSYFGIAGHRLYR